MDVHIRIGFDDDRPILRDGLPVQAHEVTRLGRNGRPTTKGPPATHGTRTGQWDLSRAVPASAIDDGSPLPHSVQSDRYAHSERVDPSQASAESMAPIPATALLKLRRAIIADREQERKAANRGDAATAFEEPTAEMAGAEGRHFTKDDLADASPSPKHSKAIPAFHIPQATAKKGIRIISRDGEELVIRQPEGFPPLEKDKVKPTGVDKLRTVQQRHSSSTASRLAVFTKPKDQTQRVRIKDKNGDECVVELPGKARLSRAANDYTPENEGILEFVSHREEHPRWHEEVRSSQTVRKGGADVNVKSLHSRGTSQAANTRPRVSPAKPDSVTSVHSEPTQSSSDTVSSRSISLTKTASRRGQDNSRGEGSKQSSMTSTQTLDQHTRANVLHSSKSCTSRPKEVDWQEIGVGQWGQVSGAATAKSERYDQQSDRLEETKTNDHPSPTHKSRRDHGPVGPSLRRITNNSKSPRQAEYSKSAKSVELSHKTDRNAQAAGIHAQAPIDSRQTIHAGRGWISPHPLSLVSSAYQRPPQEAIRLPSADDHQGRLMTYEEWKAIRAGIHEPMRSRMGSRSGSRTTDNGQARATRHRTESQATATHGSEVLEARVDRSSLSARSRRHMDTLDGAAEDECSPHRHGGQSLPARRQVGVAMSAISGFDPLGYRPRERLRMPWD